MAAFFALYRRTFVVHAPQRRLVLFMSFPQSMHFTKGPSPTRRTYGDLNGWHRRQRDLWHRFFCLPSIQTQVLKVAPHWLHVFIDRNTSTCSLVSQSL